jgi:light-regulated signal transduction histidine kinase (bacteriophytochrome)
MASSPANMSPPGTEPDAGQIDALDDQVAELEEIVDRVAHALREPLGAVLGFAGILTRSHDDAAMMERAADRIVEAALILDRRVEEALAFSSASHEPLQLEPTDCEALVAEALRGTAARPGAASLPTVVGDSGKLATVFSTLVSVARATGDERQSHVEVDAVREGGSWRFSVTAGAPLKGVDLGSFELFGRRARPGEWSADLAICRRLIERHGGRIWLEPEGRAPTAFTFTLAA